MNDYVFYLYRLLDEEVEAIGNLLDWKESTSFWQSLDNEDKCILGREIDNRVIDFIPKCFKTSQKLPIPYAFLLEMSYAILNENDKDSISSNEVHDIENEIITKLFNKLISKASPEELKGIWESLEVEANKIGVDLKISDLTPSAALMTTLIIGQLGGFATYILATTATASIASVLGVTLPFAFYTTLTSTIATFLGPVGWVTGGLIGALQLGTAFARAKDRKKKLRLLALTTCLIQIKSRISKDIQVRSITNIQALQKLEEEIAILNEIIKEQDKETEELTKAKADKEALKIKLEASDNQNKKLIGLVEQYKKELKRQQAKGDLNFPLVTNRQVPISSGVDRTIWGDMRVTKLSDIPSEKDRNLFSVLMQHKNVQSILLGDYDGSSNPKPTNPPILRLSKDKASLRGKLLTKAIKKNACKLRIVVDSETEDSVFRYGVSEGIITPIR